VKRQKIRRLLAELLEEIQALRKPAPPATGRVHEQTLHLDHMGVMVFTARLMVAGKQLAICYQFVNHLEAGSYPITVEFAAQRQGFATPGQDLEPPASLEEDPDEYRVDLP